MSNLLELEDRLRKGCEKAKGNSNVEARLKETIRFQNWIGGKIVIPHGN